MKIVTLVHQVLLGLVYLLSDSVKLIGTKHTLQQRGHPREAPWFWHLRNSVRRILKSLYKAIRQHTRSIFYNCPPSGLRLPFRMVSSVERT